MPPEPVDLIKCLLIQEPNERLGVGGAAEVKVHEFFEHVNWTSLLRQKAEFVPVLDNEEDTSYFDSKIIHSFIYLFIHSIIYPRISLLFC